MECWRLCLLVVVLLPSITQAASKSKYLYRNVTHSVIDYTETQGRFEESTHPRVVEFYSPYCGACRGFQPKYIALAEELQQVHKEIEVYAVSCVAHKDMCKKYQIKAYPTLVLFRQESTEPIKSTVRDAAGMLEALQLKGPDQVEQVERKALEEKTGNEKPNQPAPKGNSVKPAGAGAARNAPRSDVDKYKDLVRQKMEEKRKQQQQQQRGVGLKGAKKNNPKVPVQLGQVREGATDTMKANTPGTPEYEARRKEIREKIAKFKGKKVASVVNGKNVAKPAPAGASSATGTVKKLPYKKEATKPRIVEKLPVVKQFTHMSHEEELIIDVSLSFIRGLKFGLFTSDRPLANDKKRILRDWLDLLSVSLPPEWSIHDIIDDLYENFDFITQSDKNMETTLRRHRFPRRTWSKSCSSSVDRGFHCGFWKLLHVLTIGIAEHKGGQNLIDASIIRADATVFSPLKAADTLRNYIANFFACAECKQNFVKQYEDCDRNRRCARLTNFAHNATGADWKELSKWLWEFHNEVNVRLLRNKEARKKKKPKAVSSDAELPEMQNEVKALWPTLDQCILCYREDGTWNEDAVFAYLEKTYWSDDSGDDPWADLLLRFEGDDDYMPHGSRITIFLGCIGVVLLFFVRRNLSQSGLQQTVLMAKSLGPRGAFGAKKRSV